MQESWKLWIESVEEERGAIWKPKSIYGAEGKGGILNYGGINSTKCKSMEKKNKKGEILRTLLWGSGGGGVEKWTEGEVEEEETRTLFSRHLLCWLVWARLFSSFFFFCCCFALLSFVKYWDFVFFFRFVLFDDDIGILIVIIGILLWVVKNIKLYC